MDLHICFLDSDSDGNTETTLSTAELRNRLRNRIFRAVDNGENIVIESPTSSGKTHTVSTTPWRKAPKLTGDEPVLFFSHSKKARDEAMAKSEQADDVEPYRLLGGEDACPVYGGEYDSDNTCGNTPIRKVDDMEPSEWFKTRCQVEGWPLSAAHHEYNRKLKEDLPCGSSCQALTQWRDIPRDEDGNVQYDVIHGCHPMARVPGLIQDCNIFFDEQPDFSKNHDTNELRRPITKYLGEMSEDVPSFLTSFGNLLAWVETVPEQERKDVADRLETPSPDWFRDESHSHALAPGVTEAFLRSEEQCHDRLRGMASYEYPDFPSNTETPDYQVSIRLVFDDENEIRLLQVVPDFSQARCVIGLDAYPTEPKWQANTVGYDGL